MLQLTRFPSNSPGSWLWVQTQLYWRIEIGVVEEPVGCSQSAIWSRGHTGGAALSLLAFTAHELKRSRALRHGYAEVGKDPVVVLVEEILQ